MTINQRIKFIRKELRLSQKQFADRLGVKQTTVSFWERDGSTIAPQNCKLICSEFNISFAWLSSGVGKPTSGISDNLFNEIKELYNLSFLDVALIKNICELSSEQRSDIRTIYSYVKSKKEEG